MGLEKNLTTGLIVEFFGPTVEFLTSPEDEHNNFCVLKATIPPGVSVPLHSHPDKEDFFIISGSVEGLRATSGWKPKRAITFTCQLTHRTLGVMSPVNLSST